MAVSKTKQALNSPVFLAYLEELEVEDMMLAFVIKEKLMLNKRRHRFWIHEIIKRRKKFGAFYHLVKHIELDSDKYHEYFRMSAQQLEVILGFVGPIISKKAVVRETIDPKQRLAMCIR